MTYATISDIQKFSLSDGPGIRSTVFLKGCNMHCLWCHNPESIRYDRTLEIYSAKCISCGACYRVCQTGAMKFGISVYDSPKTTSLSPIYLDKYREYDKSKCIGCARCADVCPAGALRLVGEKMSAEEVFSIVAADKDYYTSSGGGVTLSGGEPTMQPEFCLELLRLCHEEGFDTAIETNLTADFSVLENMLPYLSRLFCDFKVFDDSIHRAVTGVTNKCVMDNLRYFSEYDIPVVVRTPLIPGISDSVDNISSIAKWLVENTHVEYYELLNYNQFAESKYNNIHEKYELAGKKKLSAARIGELLNLSNSCGIKTFCGEK